MAMCYVCIVIGKRRELPESISSLVYELPVRWQYLWTVWLWLVGLGVCIPMMDLMPEDYAFVCFLTLACLGFVGAMPLFMIEHRKAHNIFGVSAGILSQICVLLVSPWWLLVWCIFLAVAIFVFFNKENKWFDKKMVFVAEVICSLSIYGAVLTELICGA